MNVDACMPKTCCFFFKLRTGCYIIGISFLLLSCFCLGMELETAVLRFSHRVENGIVAVAFAYDLSPSVMFTFSVCLIYGLYKEIALLIYPGVTLLSLLVAFAVYFIILEFIYGIEYGFHGSSKVFILYFIFIAVLSLLMIVLLSHYKEVKTAKQTARRGGGNNFHEFENPQALPQVL